MIAHRLSTARLRRPDRGAGARRDRRAGHATTSCCARGGALRAAVGATGRAPAGADRSAKPSDAPPTLVVLGMMGRCPFGGQTWLYLNWLRGLHGARPRRRLRRGRRDLALRPARQPRSPTTRRYAAAYLDRVHPRDRSAGPWAYRPLYRGGAEVLRPVARRSCASSTATATRS